MRKKAILESLAALADRADSDNLHDVADLVDAAIANFSVGMDFDALVAIERLAKTPFKDEVVKLAFDMDITPAWTLCQEITDSGLFNGDGPFAKNMALITQPIPGKTFYQRVGHDYEKIIKFLKLAETAGLQLPQLGRAGLDKMPTKEQFLSQSALPANWCKKFFAIMSNIVAGFVNEDTAKRIDLPTGSPVDEQQAAPIQQQAEPGGSSPAQAFESKPYFEQATTPEKASELASPIKKSIMKNLPLLPPNLRRKGMEMLRFVNQFAARTAGFADDVYSMRSRSLEFMFSKFIGNGPETAAFRSAVLGDAKEAWDVEFPEAGETVHRPETPTQETIQPPEQASYMLIYNGEEYGPLSMETLKEWTHAGRIMGDSDLMISEQSGRGATSNERLRADEIPEIKAVLDEMDREQQIPPTQPTADNHASPTP